MRKQASTRNREKLSQLSREELVEIILAQQEVIEDLKQEIEKLKISRESDSKTSSKPPSSDLLKKSEKKKEQKLEKKKKPGGQPGHQGKTRKGFGRVDRARSFKSKQLSPLWSRFVLSSSRQNRKTCGSTTSRKPNRSSRVSTSSS